MKRTLTIDSSDEGHIEICYDMLSLDELNSRIRAHQKKYGMSFSRFLKGFSCDSATPDEMTDYMDWKLLIEERVDRMRPATKKN